MRRILFLGVAAVLVVGCRDALTDVDFPEPSFAILDGTRAGGNPDFFFLPPMVHEPRGGFLDPFDPNFDDVVVTVCELVDDHPITEGTLCAPTQPAGFPIVFTMTAPGLGGEMVRLETGCYRVDWRTDLVSLSSDAFYRISVSAGGIAAGFADVDVDDEDDDGDVDEDDDEDDEGCGDESDDDANDDDESDDDEDDDDESDDDADDDEKSDDDEDDDDEFIEWKNGRTLPIKFRLEPGHRCFEARNAEPPVPCVATVVNLAEGGTLTTQPDNPLDPFSGVTFFPGPEGGIVSPTIGPCAAGNIPVDIPVFGDCFTVDVAGLTGDLGNPAAVFQCNIPVDDSGFPDFGLSPDQVHLLRWHRFDEGEPDPVVALPLTDDPCTHAIAMNLESNPLMRLDSNPVMRFARAVRDRVGALVGPRPLFAASPAMFWNRKSGGSSVRFSDFQLALPSKMEILEGDGQTTVVGTPVPIAPAVLVTDAHGNPVEGARVTFDITAGGGSVASPQAIVFSDVAGESRVASWTMGGSAGNNQLTASCFGCATVGEDTDGPQDLFDPFTPLPATPSDALPLPGPLADEADLGPAVSLQTGILTFTAQGHFMRVAGIGHLVVPNPGRQEADVIFSSGDLDGSITRLLEVDFNTLYTGTSAKIAQLEADFDVLLITWQSFAGLNVDWNTVLKPFLEAGGGVIYDGDPFNVLDLLPVVHATPLNRPGGGIAVTASIPGLTDGINNLFVNNHVDLTTTTFPVLPVGFTQFLTLTEEHLAGVEQHNVGMFGPVGAGCIVLTGPDQDFHGDRDGGVVPLDPEGLNQYNLLINELRFVTGISGACVP